MRQGRVTSHGLKLKWFLLGRPTQHKPRVTQGNYARHRGHAAQTGSTQRDRVQMETLRYRRFGTGPIHAVRMSANQPAD